MALLGSILDSGGGGFSLNRISATSRGFARSLAIFGDSITDQNYVYDTSGGANACYFSDNGYLTHAQALAGVDFEFKVDAGIGGNTTAQMLARIQSDVIAYSPDVCIVMGGINDLVSGRTVTQIMADLTAIYDRLRNAGILVIAASSPPKSSAPEAQYEGLASLRNKIEDYCNSNYGMIFWDAYAAGVNAASATSDWRTNYSNDGTHPNSLGAYNLGVSLAPILSRVLPAKRLVCSQSEVKSANADSNQLVANPLMIGTGGTAGANASGSVATNWTLSTNSANVSVVGSKATANSGIGEKQILTLTATGSGICSFYTAGFEASVITGNALQAAARIKIVSNTQAKQSALRLTRNAGTGKATNIFWNYYNSGTPQTVPAAEYLAAMTPPMTIVAASGSVNLFYQIEFTAAGNAVVEIEQAEVRDVGTSVGQIDNNLG